MTKMSGTREESREHLENAQAALAAAWKRLDLAEVRVGNAISRGMEQVLEPATQELAAARRSINRARRELGILWAADWQIKAKTAEGGGGPGGVAVGDCSSTISKKYPEVNRKMSIFTDDLQEARTMTAQRVCSDCYEPLLAYNDAKTGQIKLSCSTPGCECRGTVAKKTVEIRTQESANDYLNAKMALAGLLPRKTKSETQALSELGF